MRAFIILCSLVAVAYAGNGYFYGPGISGSLPNNGRAVLNGVQGVGTYGISGRTSYTAPVAEQFDEVATEQLDNTSSKNLMVMFVKGAESNAVKDAAVQLAENSGETVEHETIIYLLAKQTDTSELLEKLQQLQQSVPATPEVRIIKYRTPEQLSNAVKVVQSQYNDVGGPSNIINGGVVPVINYASAGQSFQAPVNFVRTGLGSQYSGLGGRSLSLLGYGPGSVADNNLLRKYR